MWKKKPVHRQIQTRSVLQASHLLGTGLKSSLIFLDHDSLANTAQLVCMISDWVFGPLIFYPQPERKNWYDFHLVINAGESSHLGITPCCKEEEDVQQLLSPGFILEEKSLYQQQSRFSPAFLNCDPEVGSHFGFPQNVGGCSLHQPTMCKPAVTMDGCHKWRIVLFVSH